MKFRFTKMHGCGNDFLILNAMEGHAPELYPAEIQFLCDRHFGLGADGIVILESAEETNAAWKFYNSDGSEAEMCGNAARCAIRYLAERYLKDFEVIGIRTKAGIIRGRLLPEVPGLVEITLFSQGDVKFNYEQLSLKTDKEVFDGYWLDTGVPHFVIEVKDIHSYPIARVGKLLLHHPKFGDSGSNITFFQGLVGSRIRSTTYERGVEGETFACGTGVAAAAIVYSELYMQAFPIEVNAPGGDLLVDLSPVSKMLVLQGSAEYVGEMEVDELPSNFEPPQLYGERKRVT